LLTDIIFPRDDNNSNTDALVEKPRHT
jgi:hypothetical protein